MVRSSAASAEADNGGSSSSAQNAAPSTTSRINVYVRIRPPSLGGGNNSNSSNKVCVAASSTAKRRGNLTQVNNNKQQQQPKKNQSNQQQLVTVTSNERGGQSQTQKTYSFDQVFDHSSTQSELFESCARHVIDEVLEGYNCTLFAYGQTGTGKTYTMSGDSTALSDLQSLTARISSNDNEVPDAANDSLLGIIPRCLKCFFEHFDKNKDLETVMKLSFVELYNEELYDLLSLEENTNVKVKIYDDKDGKLQISGMEEKNASTLQEALRIFDYGTKRRTTAETLMNRESSRSHSVFILSIYMQEAGIDNTGIVKCGKLNLVDLAGSENISKSGVSDKQKREASNINQSLLTLGRVINMLSTGVKTYIPYRDSKLTRILKDSLGGKTKTSMIATISPHASNLEETISTLEYAHQSKNIKNRPEINRKVTQNAIHRNMAFELQKLQRDLDAQRSKSGVYIDQENYEALKKELADNKVKLEEQNELIADYYEENSKFLNGLTSCLKIINHYEPRAIEIYNECLNKHDTIETFKEFHNRELEDFFNLLKKTLPHNSSVFEALCKANIASLPAFREFLDHLNDDMKCFIANELQISKRSTEGHKEWPKIMSCNLQTAGDALKSQLKELETSESKFHASHIQFLIEEAKQNLESVKKAEQCRDGIHSGIESLRESFQAGCNSFIEANTKCVSSLSSTCDMQHRQNNQLSNSIPAVQKLINDYQTKVVDKVDAKLEESEKKLLKACQAIDTLKTELSGIATDLATLKLDASRQWSVFKDEAYGLTKMQLTSIEDSKKSTSQLQLTMNKNKAVFSDFCNSFIPDFKQKIADASSDVLRSMQSKLIDRMVATGQAFDNQRTTYQSFEAAHAGQLKALKTRGIDEFTSNILERLQRQPEVAIAEIAARQSRLDKLFTSINKSMKSSLADLDKLVDEYYKAEKNYKPLKDLSYPEFDDLDKENVIPEKVVERHKFDPTFNESELSELISKPKKEVPNFTPTTHDLNLDTIGELNESSNDNSFDNIKEDSDSQNFAKKSKMQS